MTSPVFGTPQQSRELRRPAGPAVPSEWIVENFKAIEHATVPLGQLVVLMGTNSSGKSSVIQSLLLVAQSTDDGIILNGPLVRLGEPSDAIRTGCGGLTVAYSANTRASGADTDREWSFELGLVAAKSSLRVAEFFAAVDGEPILAASHRRVTRRVEAEVNAEGHFGDTVLRISEIEGRKAPPRTFLGFRGLYPEALIIRRGRDQVLASMRRNYKPGDMRENPERVWQLYQELQPWWRSHGHDLPQDVVEIFHTIISRPQSSTRFSFDERQADLDALFNAFAASADPVAWVSHPVPRHPSAQFRPTDARGLTLGLSSLGIAADCLRTIRESVRYLGPLREEPQVVSATGGHNRSAPAGTKGEYTADLLVREKSKVVAFFDWNRKRIELTLPDAVSFWTTYLGIGENVAVYDYGKLGRGLTLVINDVERDLTTIGVGASQLLPVLAVVLSAAKDSIVCLEQPELHLHPAVQSKLADFFLWARPDITLLIETHSEYLVTRLRRRVAEGLTRTDRATILFAEQVAGITTLKQLSLSRLGDLSDWPAGFFDTQEEDAKALVRAVTDTLHRQ